MGTRLSNTSNRECSIALPVNMNMYSSAYDTKCFRICIPHIPTKPNSFAKLLSQGDISVF